jgi:hypothetical protein
MGEQESVPLPVMTTTGYEKAAYYMNPAVRSEVALRDQR